MNGRVFMDYKFKVTGVFRKCLDTQVDEGLRLTEFEASGAQNLNSKNEFYAPVHGLFCINCGYI